MSMFKGASLAAALGVLLAMPAASAVASSPTAGQRAAFSALRGSPVKTLPPAVDRFVDSPVGSVAGVDAANVYRVTSPRGGHWDVLSGRGEICIVLEDHEGISGCASNGDAQAGRLRVMLITPQKPSGSADAAIDGQATIAGLVPDGTQPRFGSAGLRRLPTVNGADGAYESDAGSGTAAIAAMRALSQRTALGRTRRPHVVAYAANTAYMPYGAGSGHSFSSGWGTPDRFPIVSTSAESADGNWMCANTVNADGSWGGTTTCTTVFQPASHPWNGSSRYGWAGNGVAGVTTYGIAWLNT